MGFLCEKEYCTGCGACVNSCPVNCIRMEADGEGFFYPSMDGTRCIGCGKCSRACPALRPRRPAGGETRAYAAHCLDDALLKDSASGGLSALLALDMLERGGAVFGAVFDGHFQVRHRMLEQKEELPALQGSKYAQSHMGDAYRRAKELLEAGRPVLFTGTPCQIAGLRTFLGRDYDGLLCQDLICHSIPSPGVWENYLAELEEAQGSPAEAVSFRDKEEGWGRYRFRTEFADGSVRSVPGREEAYMRAFLGGLICRPSCHRCGFKGISRPSDITLADFWGVKKVCPEAMERQGVSLALVHTPRGGEALARLAGKAAIREVDPGEAVKYNPAAVRAMPESPNRSAFWAGYTGRGLAELVSSCLDG